MVGHGLWRRAARSAGILAVLVTATAQASDSNPADRPVIVAARVACPVACPVGYPNQGYAVEMLRAILEPTGSPILYRTMSWDRLLVESQRGTVTLTITAETEQFATGIRVNRPVGRTVDVLAMESALAERFSYDGTSSLRRLRVGAVRDDRFNDTALNQHLEDMASLTGAVQRLAGENPMATNVRKLFAGRIDAVLGSRITLTYELKRIDRLREVALIPIADPYDIFILVSPSAYNAPGMVHLIEHGVDRLRATGRLASILSQYGLEDWADTPGPLAKR